MQGAPQPEERSESGAPPTTRSAETFSAELVPSSASSVPQRTPGSGQRSAPASKLGLSIFQKLLLLILSLTFVTVALPAVYLSSRQLSRMQALLELKVEMYARLVAKQVESAVAFNDRETAREVFDSLVQDPELASVTLFASDGSVLKAHGTVSEAMLAERTATRAQVLVMADRVAAVMPVVSLEGPRGTLVLELSMNRLKVGRADVLGQALVGGSLALLVGAAGAFWIARSLGNRLKVIARAAGTVAQGRLDEPALEDDRNDEIGTLAGAFNAMLLQLRALITQIQRSALEEQRRLAQLVQERTSELDSRNADMRLVLDHVGQGFVMLGRDGKMSRERSAILERWLGPAPDGDLFADYLSSAGSASLGAWFALGWEAVIEGTLPLDLELDQLPKSLSIDERTIHIGYRPIFSAEGVLERVLVVLSDLTPELQRTRAEADERELTLLCTRLFSDRDAILEFRAEVDALLEHIRTTLEPDALRRWLHTLKGSASLYGVDSLAALCHELEERLNEGALTPELIAPLGRRWAALQAKLEPLLETQSGRIQIDVDEYEALLDAVERDAPRALIQRTLADWRLEPVHARLARLAEHAERLADRLAKAPIEVKLDAGKLRLAREAWGEFWSAAVHVVRNAVDHGLEHPDERERLGKRLPARLELRARLVDQRFVIEFKDDGRGIDWDAVATKARDNGLPAVTRGDLIDALFATGISTRATATDVSGRGVGLDVVRDACRRSGGAIEVETERGRGTTFRFAWPIERLDGVCRSGRHPLTPRTAPRRAELSGSSSSEVASKGTLRGVAK